MAHAGAGGIGHFRGLQVQVGVLELVQAAGMVVMQVGDDRGIDAVRRDADRRQRRRRLHVERGGAVVRLFRLKPRVDEDRPVVVADHPDEIVDRRLLETVIVEHEEIAAGPVRAAGVSQGIDLVMFCHRAVSSLCLFCVVRRPILQRRGMAGHHPGMLIKRFR